MQLEWVKMGFLLLFEMMFTYGTNGTLVAWGSVTAEISMWLG